VVSGDILLKQALSFSQVVIKLCKFLIKPYKMYVCLVLDLLSVGYGGVMHWQGPPRVYKNYRPDNETHLI
jgi:hypothetical protein